MSGFGFNEAQEMFRREVRNFARRELAPGAKARAKGETIPTDLWKKVANAGFTGISLPEEYGGQPADWVTVGILIEEVGRVEFALYHPILMGIAAGIVLKESSEENRREWLPSVIRGDRIICLALTEPGCGSDAAALTTRAVREGDHYVLSGEKTSITQGMQADAALLFAKTDPAARARGVSCFLVPLDLPGVVRSGLPTMGFRPLKAASIILDGVRIPARYRMGEEGRGFHMVMGQFDVIRPCLGLAALGAAQASLEEAIAYAKQRTAFGQPIGKFEGVSFKIAEHLTRMEAARWLCYRTLWLRDQGISHTKESAMCKWLCPEVAVQAIHDALLLHGHLGYSEEYPIEQRLRDVIGLEIGDGTAQIMKLIITRETLGREFLPY